MHSRSPGSGRPCPSRISNERQPRRGPHPPSFAYPGQHLVKMVRKRLPVALAQRRRSAGMNSAGPQRIHEVAHVEPLADGLRGMELAARAERMSAVSHHLGRQRYVGGNDEVAAFCSFRDFVVRNVESPADLHELDVRRRGNAHRLIGDQGDPDPGPFGRSEQDLPDRHRARIGVHPDLHIDRHRWPQNRNRVVARRANPIKFLTGAFAQSSVRRPPEACTARCASRRRAWR